VAERPDIQALRERIEAIDREILDALRRRMEAVDEVVEAKLDAASPLRDPPREEHVLARVREQAAELGLDPHEVERLYRGLMEMSVARQEDRIRARPTAPLRVAYQGVEGSYSHLAARGRYGGREGGVVLAGFPTFRGAVESVLGGGSDLALLPIENTTAGSINETYDLLAEGALAITGEVVSRIEHCLLGLSGSTVEGLRAVVSHPQALAQCERFLRTLPRVEARAEYDTAGAARKVAEGGDRTVAAIASATTAASFGLEILARSIQSEAGNYTRFVEVSPRPASCPPDRPCKTSLLVELAHEPGALQRVLACFARRGVDLSKIESRPIPDRPFSYRFYVDLDGHAASRPVEAALAEAREVTTVLRVLGTYPRDRTA
jgi:chorismate mutase/prephenate dehydratase